MKETSSRIAQLLLGVLLVSPIGAACSGDASEQTTTVDSEHFLERRAELRATVRCRAELERCEGKPPPQGTRQDDSVKACRKRLVKKWAASTTHAARKRIANPNSGVT